METCAKKQRNGSKIRKIDNVNKVIDCIILPLNNISKITRTLRTPHVEHANKLSMLNNKMESIIAKSIKMIYVNFIFITKSVTNRILDSNSPSWEVLNSNKKENGVLTMN